MTAAVTTAAISGFTAAQNVTLSAVQVGDLIFVSKSVVYDNDGDMDEDEDDEDDEDDETGDYSEIDEDDDQQDEGGSSEGDEGEHEGDTSALSSDAQGSASTAQSSIAELYFAPAMYVATTITNTKGAITDLQVAPITYSEMVGDDHEHGNRKYHIYADQCLTQHGDCTTCDDSKSITEVAIANNFTFQVKPNGDRIRSFVATNPQRRCIARCSDGWLDSIDTLSDLMQDYNAPLKTWNGGQLPGFLQRPVCPVCVGVQLLHEQQNVQFTLLTIGLASAMDLFGLFHEFHSRLNLRRRTQLHYSFKQFDEREWGYAGFDDMLSDEDGDDEGEDDGGRFEHWEEAMDPSNNAPFRPASDTTIMALSRRPRSTLPVEMQAESSCVFCTEKLNSETTMVELPCQHVFEEDCIVKWLKQYDNCPNCRAQLPREESSVPSPTRIQEMDEDERQDYADAGDHFSSINGLGLSGDDAIAAAIAASIFPQENQDRNQADDKDNDNDRTKADKEDGDTSMSDE